MKKLFVLLALIFPICAFAEENIYLDGITEPAWQDFAPKAFADVTEPKGVAKFNETASYWYKRKVDFENGIEECRALSENDEKFGCYQQLKIKQYQLNSDYNARVEAYEINRKGPREMFDKTDTMLPIGGYLNNLGRFQPNEFR